MQRIYSKLLLLTLFSITIFAQEQIGVAAAVNRNTTDLTLEQERRLVEAGYQIIQNHTIETDEIGKAQMLLLDGTAFSVGPNSSVVLDRFIYNPATAEGSLEVTARGLLRIVGGKVTKKQPALIRTNSATVGIRGGIGIVQTDGSKVNATFLYGEEMTVTPNCVDLDTFGDQCSNDFITTITEPGFSVSVESADSEPSEPEPVTEESLEAVQDELEASEEEPAEEESSSDESSSEESSEESSSEESSDESSSEESSDESSDESSSDDSSSEESSSDESSSDESSSEESSGDESSADESVASDDTGDSSSDEPTTEVAQDTETETETTTEVADAGDSSDIEVNEDLLDSSGVSDVSSDVAPDELGTADAFEVETEVDLVDVDDSPAEDVNEEVADTAQETTAEVAPTEVAPVFEVEIATLVESVDENTTEISLTEFVLVNPGEQNYTVNIAGEGSEAFTYNQETNSLEITEGLDHESQEAVELTVTFTSDNGDVQTVDLELAVADVDEAATVNEIALVNTISETAISAELVANQVNVSETVNAGTVIATFSATDPEGNALEYSLSGTDANQFTVNTAGEVSLAGSLDYETASVVTLMLEVSDGVHTTLQEIVINVVNDDEPAAIATSFVDSAVAESVAIGAVIGTVNATDPEGNSVTYSLSGTGSDNFSVDANGNITVINSLDYESASAYELTLVVDDGTYAATETLTISVADVNEAPSLSTSVAFNAFQENTATGTTIATSSVTDPEAGAITYSLSGTGSENFAVSSDGTVTLANSLDYETATAYEITLTANDGANSVSQTITVNVGDINEAPAVSLTVAAASVAEDVSTGTSIATSSVSDPESDSVSYTLAGVGSSNFNVDANGTITVANSLDYETQTSYELTLTVSDGTSSTQETFQISITDVDEFTLALSSTSPAINEGVSTGTEVATSTLTQQDSAAVTYSLSGTGSDKFAISSTGVITTAAAMDYETTSSYSLTVTVTDGTNTDTETINISINDVSINTLATTLANSGAALAESSSSGTAVASSSISNPDSETITYTLSGTGSSNFSVDSSGNVTTNATLDFETAQSYALTLTATAGSTSVTDTFTVNVGNVEELNSAVLRYSAAYNSASRTGFSATATRGPSGSSLPAYYLEQVGTTNTTAISSVQNYVAYDTDDYVPVEINSGTQLNWRYYFPIDRDGSGTWSFAPSSAELDGKYYSPLGTAVTTSISNSEFITAGRLETAEYWFMTTDKAGSNISYQSSGGQRTYAVIAQNSSYYEGTASGVSGLPTSYQWDSALTSAGYTLQVCSNGTKACLQNAGIGLNEVGIMIVPGLGSTSLGYTNSEIADWIDAGGNYHQVAWEHSGGCCGSTANMSQVQGIFSSLGWTGLSGAGGMGTSSLNISQSWLDNITNNGGTLDYSGLVGKQFEPAAIGYMNVPSVCNELGSGYTGLVICDPGRTGSDGTVMLIADVNAFDHYSTGGNNYEIMQWFAGLNSGSATTSTYNLFEDQVTLAGEVYTDTHFADFTNGNKRVIAMAVIPIENFAPSSVFDDYFYPNFIPTNFWSYGEVGVDYCLAMGQGESNCLDYENQNRHYNRPNYYQFAQYALDRDTHIQSARFYNTTSNNYVPEGMSLWWQVLNPSGVGVGLWAQISIKDSYDGASGSTTRDDQESLLNVIISNIDYRKNDTTRYSAGDTGLGMDGYHYWSYQGATNTDPNGLGINYGTSPVECATSNDSGCFWGDTNYTHSTNRPGGAMFTSSDPYKSGDMTLGVNYNSDTNQFSTGTFNISAVTQSIRKGSGYVEAVSLSDFRSSDFYDSSASSYSGFFSGILEFNDLTLTAGIPKAQMASIRSSSTLASFTFDTTNDDLQVVAPMTISAAPSNTFTSRWTTVDTGSMTLKFGDATNDTAKSAYISSEVFGAEIQDDGAQIDGSSGGSNNLAGVMVSYNTLDKEDSDLFHTNGNDSMPDTAYSTWGFWAMSSADISPNTGDQNAAVHLGTWVGGETLAQSDIPTSGSASMSGAAVMRVASRYNGVSNNYGVHKYTTTADVAASFTWGSSGYSGTLDFTNFDDKNPIVANAGFTAFTVAITGTDHTYTGNSTTSLQNDWLGGASVAGALYGDTSPDESGGRINVNIYKSSGNTQVTGSNDFYMAEGIYLLD